MARKPTRSGAHAFFVLAFLVASSSGVAQEDGAGSLTEADKARIRQEEIFRREVQMELAKASPPQSAGGSIWAFLNSSFGLWTLSTLVVGVISWGYRRWRERREDHEFLRSQELETQSAVRKLDLEIASRLRNFEKLMENASDLDGYYNALISLEGGSLLFSRNVFPDFENRPIESLIWELMLLLPDSNRAEVYPAFLAVQYLADNRAGLGENVIKERDRETPLWDQAEVRQRVGDTNRRIGDAFRLLRWDSPIGAHRRTVGT